MKFSGTKDVTMTVKTGDRVVVGKYTGNGSSWTAWIINS